MKTKAAALSLLLCVLTQTTPVHASDDAAFRSEILNGVCCVPNLSSGYSPVRLKNGTFKSNDPNDQTEVEIRDILFGKLDGTPIALAVMSQSGGGSGIFNSLLVYEQHNGKAITVGSYPIGDRTLVKSLKIADGKVHITTEETIGHDGGKQTSLVLPRNKFENVECLQEPLSAEVQKDVDALTALWSSIDAKNPKLSPEKKKEALAICNRHKKDREAFANAFRLTLSAQGWGPGPHPLSFEKDGRPSLEVDDVDSHARVDLDAP